MNMPISERRQIENEMIFRLINEKVGMDLDEINALHLADGNPELVRKDDWRLYFNCECSDENCDARIGIKLSTYRKIHLDRDSFVIKLNHQVNPIEKIILTEANYSVVRKNNSTSDPGKKLNKTPIDNAEA